MEAGGWVERGVGMREGGRDVGMGTGDWGLGGVGWRKDEPEVGGGG